MSSFIALGYCPDTRGNAELQIRSLSVVSYDTANGLVILILAMLYMYLNSCIYFCSRVKQFVTLKNIFTAANIKLTLRFTIFNCFDVTISYFSVVYKP